VPGHLRNPGPPGVAREKSVLHPGHSENASWAIFWQQGRKFHNLKEIL